MRIKKISCLLIIIIFSFGLAGCNNKTKELVLSNDVKKDVQQEQKNDVKLQKLNEISISNEYEPLYWKDDDNVIAIKQDGSKNLGIYNININSAQITQVSNFNEQFLIVHSWESGIGNQETRLLYIKDCKLWLYNTGDNSSRVIYDLTKVKDEIEKRYANKTIKRTFDKNGNVIASSIESGKTEEGAEQFKVKYDSDFYLGFGANFVKGSNKYIFLDSFDGLKILDLDSGKITDLNPLVAITYQGMRKQILYSKTKDTFYITLDKLAGNDDNYSGTIYEFKLNKPNTLKKIAQTNGDDTATISKDSTKLYFITKKTSSYSKSRDSIVSYDTSKNAIERLFENNNSEKSYYFLDCNFTNGLVVCECTDMYLQPGNNTAIFLGRLTNGKLRVIDKLGQADGSDQKLSGDVLFNESGDRFIAKSVSFDKNNTTTITTGTSTITTIINNDYKVKFYVYKISQNQ